MLHLNGQDWHARAYRCTIPPFWIPISPPSGLDPQRRRTWPLVLDALRLPRWLAGSATRCPVLLVPCLTARLSCRNIAEFEAESLPKPPAPAGPVHSFAPLAWLPLVLFLFVIHALRCGDLMPPAWLAPLLPTIPSDWTAAFAFDSVRVQVYHEWWRAGTALFMHADAGHIAANAAFSILFLHMSARTEGAAPAVFFTLLAGVLGNLLTLAVRPDPVVSAGFSTALFGCIGFWCGASGVRAGFSGMLLPVAAGCALLATLGTEGERTDYIAHICGLTAGLALGTGKEILRQKLQSLAPAVHTLFHLLCAGGALALPLSCWLTGIFH